MYGTEPFLGKEEIKKSLLDFDEMSGELLEKGDPKPKVVIVGGGAFILNDKTPRMTCDIDVLCPPSMLSGILDINNMNQRVNAYIDSFPYNFEDRLIKVDLGDTNCEYYTPSLEDLVVSKLYGLRPNDMSDLTSKETLESINWELLDYLVFDRDEVFANALSGH
ncbi:MAG: DUF6036 family nucleotidyltransferase [Coriobacteriia bacterium]|nr:DUF6036 family nucleotidyltransferase [Coriobacteriia bacterium]MCL2750358.1 DUF6036 family nucleotidyltransferase [Coriobacteriia bacterium]